MNPSDDPKLPAASFSGDSSVFELPDLLLQASATTERVVDTQSGFLVAIRKLGERLSLSVRRKVGTPPTLAVLLTPDESLQLSNILTSWSESSSKASYQASPNITTLTKFPFWQLKSQRRFSNFWQSYALGAILIFGLGTLAGFLVLGSFHQKQEAATVAADPLEPSRVESFARRFIFYMLDFNPESYRTSQIQAMSYMSPQLLEKYWQDTRFPLSKYQLSSLPQGLTVMVTKVLQKRLITKDTHNGRLAQVDVYAELVRADTEVGNPVHIQLKLTANRDKSLSIIELQDLSAR